MKKTGAKFFCENCSSEVPENAKFCKACGKFFISVRCPKCGATGTSRDFEDGCPQCGYAVNGNHKSKKNNSNKKEKVKNKKNAQSNYEKTDSSLPAWIYVVTILFLIGVIFAVYSCM